MKYKVTIQFSDFKPSKKRIIELSPKYNAIVILGPTASGKTALAVKIAEKLNTEILSIDSRQVYRGMDLGTGKDLDEYLLNDKRIPYHLIDIVDAGGDYHLFRFQEDFQSAFSSVLVAGKIPILCGGSGLYLDAVLNNYQFSGIPINQPLRESLIEKEIEDLTKIFKQFTTPYSTLADVSTKKRLIRAIEISDYLSKNDYQIHSEKIVKPIVIGLSLEINLRRKKISERLFKRIDTGMIEEVENLLKVGIPAEKLIFYGLEYKFITQYLTGLLSKQEMIDKLEIGIHQFAKRQMTFCRKMERNGLVINWLDANLPQETLLQQGLTILQNS